MKSTARELRFSMLRESPFYGRKHRSIEEVNNGLIASERQAMLNPSLNIDNSLKIMSMKAVSTSSVRSPFGMHISDSQTPANRDISGNVPIQPHVGLTALEARAMIATTNAMLRNGRSL